MANNNGLYYYTKEETDEKIGRQHGTFDVVYFNASTWTPTTVGDSIEVSGLVANATYKVTLQCLFTEGINGEARLNYTGASSSFLRVYTNTKEGLYGFTIIGSVEASSSGTIVFQRAYSGDTVSNGRYGECEWFVERLD